jgi:hypothetical protein
MREVERFVVVGAPLRRDYESRRWYGGSGSSCLVLTARGRLLEPHSTYGPSEYRLLARKLNLELVCDRSRAPTSSRSGCPPRSASLALRKHSYRSCDPLR